MVYTVLTPSGDSKEFSLSFYGGNMGINKGKVITIYYSDKHEDVKVTANLSRSSANMPIHSQTFVSTIYRQTSVSPNTSRVIQITEHTHSVGHPPTSHLRLYWIRVMTQLWITGHVAFLFMNYWLAGEQQEILQLSHSFYTVFTMQCLPSLYTVCTQFLHSNCRTQRSVETDLAWRVGRMTG